MITCTRCQGTGFLNIEQLPDDVRSLDAAAIWLWLAQPEHGPNYETQVCDCCGDGADWYGEPGRHYSKAPAGRSRPACWEWKAGPVPPKPMMMWLGFSRETPSPAKNVVRITPEVIQCDCPECEGSGSWLQYHPEPELHPDGLPCVQCKGTGRIFA